MKALTIRQPWAHLVIHGPKGIEKRTWATRHRGPLAIHASASRALLNCPQTRRRLARLGYDMPREADMAFGALIGVVNLVDVVTPDAQADDPLAVGPHCWVFTQRRALERPLPCQGNRMLWEVSCQFVKPLRTCCADDVDPAVGFLPFRRGL